MASAFPGIPEPLGKLPDKLYRAIQSFQTATAILETGEVTDSAILFSQAAERVAMWLVETGHASEDHGLGAPGSPKEHAQRRANLRQVLGVSDWRLKELAKARTADAYANSRAGGEPVDFSEELAVQARNAALKVFTALRARTGLLNPEQRQLLDHLLRQPVIPRFAPQWIDGVEEAVFLGKHTAQHDDHLVMLLHRYSQPQTRSERLTAARLALLTATRARNQGRMRGPDGALAWSRQAMRLYKGEPNAFRVGFLLRLQSIALAHIGDYDAAWDRAQLAHRVAASDKRATHLLRNQEAVLLMHAGRLEEARAVALDLVAQAEAWGDQDQLRRRQLTLGRIVSRLGAWDEAEDLIVRGISECPRDQIIVHAVAEMSLANNYARSGALDKLYASANIVGSLVRPYGLTWQVSRAQSILQALERNLDRRHLVGEDDVC